MALGPSSPAASRPAPAARASVRPEPALIPDAFLDQLKDRADIVSVVGKRVALRKAGSVMVGLCPFHREKSPSFTVSESRNTYHCFGCGAHGNPLGFILEHDGLPFRQAVRELAAEVGLPLPAEMAAGGAASVPTEPLYAAMQLAQRYFRHVLAQSPSAIEYVKSRGLNNETLKRFCIGYAPDEWQGLREAFADYGRNEAILSAGLVREKEMEASADAPARTRRYDTFRNRLTFGVRDSRGRIVAFGGRIIGEGEPKYLNSPESPIFDKSGTLFGLFEAREEIRSRGHALVVEGYVDVAMLAQHGVGNAVATMGTACTRWHLERLFTQTSRIVFCFDGDAAGRKAAWRACETVAGLIEDEHRVQFLVLPDNLDPDDFVRQRGREAFEALVEQAPGFTEYLISTLQERFGITGGEPPTPRTAEARAQFAAAASAVAGRISYRCKLRRIAMDAIAAEAQMPGVALQTLAAQRRTAATPAQHTLWARLLAAVPRAPIEARRVRSALAELLDPGVDDERALLEALQALDGTVDTEEADAGDDETDAEPGAADLAAAREDLPSRDLLRAAVDLICEEREREVRAELARQRTAGEISDSDYLRQLQALRTG